MSIALGLAAAAGLLLAAGPAPARRRVGTTLATPYLYEIELDPLPDRRTRELFYIEPYFARGIRVGSFVVFPEAQVGVTGTSNIFRNSARLSDSALEVASNVRAVSDWRTHAVEVRASGLATFYDHFPTEDDRSYAIEARGRLDLSKRPNVEALAL